VLVRLSVCLIARNEEQNLPRALKSVGGVADEVIVTDTGSTDATVDIASQFGAQVHHFPWCDDFSAARNFTLDQARGRWVLWLDADEELLPVSDEGLSRSLDSDHVLAYNVIVQDLVRSDRLDLYAETWHLRLFRLDPDLRFRGRCHPQFFPPVHETAKGRDLSVATSTITLRHYGYVPSVLRSKLERGLRLLELELHDRPGQFYYLVEYGRTLLALGNDEQGWAVVAEAAEQLVPFLNRRAPFNTMVAPLLESLLQLPEDRLPPGISMNTLSDLSERWFPKAAPLLWIKAKREFSNGAFEEAERILRLLLEMGSAHSYDRSVGFNPAIVGDDALLNLGACLLRQGKMDEAERCFKGLLKSDTRGSEARSNLDAIDRLRRDFGVRRTRNETKRR
jgi:tetratricopeptide (TPR) repeat protein